MDLKLGRNMKYLLDFENKPHKMILSKDYRKFIWMLLLLSNNPMDDSLQGKMWLLASGAANLINLEHNRNYYYILRDQNMEYPNPCFNQIELDLRRTFPNDPAEHMEKYIGPLRNVLSTFVKRNPTIGYCQGMNFIVGNLLKYLNEEESFWVFVTITENILPIDYYSDMLGILVD
jgi:TBC1 domain family member 8/9